MIKINFNFSFQKKSKVIFLSHLSNGVNSGSKNEKIMKFIFKMDISSRYEAYTKILNFMMSKFSNCKFHHLYTESFRLASKENDENYSKRKWRDEYNLECYAWGSQPDFYETNIKRFNKSSMNITFDFSSKNEEMINIVSLMKTIVDEIKANNNFLLTFRVTHEFFYSRYNDNGPHHYTIRLYFA